MQREGKVTQMEEKKAQSGEEEEDIELKYLAEGEIAKIPAGYKGN